MLCKHMWWQYSKHLLSNEWNSLLVHRHLFYHCSRLQIQFTLFIPRRLIIILSNFIFKLNKYEEDAEIDWKFKIYSKKKLALYLSEIKYGNDFITIIMWNFLEYNNNNLCDSL